MMTEEQIAALQDTNCHGCLGDLSDLADEVRRLNELIKRVHTSLESGRVVEAQDLLQEEQSR